ncbi:MAG: ATP-binding cassette domain-containing protein [Thermomicrobiales bacterium]
MAGDAQIAAALELRDLRHRYRRAADDVLSISYVFTPGRTILLGPNGAGKSTLLQLCANWIRLQHGAIWLRAEGQAIPSTTRAYRACVGFMPQHPAFIRGMSARDQLVYSGWFAGLSEADAHRQASVWLERTNLSRDAGKRCSELSGGMQRRLAFAAAAIAEPPVLLLDEPTVGLDPHERSTFREILMDYDDNAIVLISTHQIDDLDMLADEIAVLSEGELVFGGLTDVFLRLADAGLPTLARRRLTQRRCGRGVRCERHSRAYECGMVRIHILFSPDASSPEQRPSTVDLSGGADLSLE